MVKRSAIGALIGFLANACQTAPKYEKTVPYVDIERFMGKWYVIATRPTMFENGAHNATESYSLDPTAATIDVDFTMHKGSFTGPVRSIPQKATVFDKGSNAHWKIAISWIPWDLDYLIIGLAEDYSWTAVGVPNQKYLWIMARRPTMDESLLTSIIADLQASGYRTDELVMIPQQW